ncbi:MAG: glycosyltransferase [Desulfovibrionaceae bacterium]|nr:glycosyltransferase [Desulfovibrionaceae bacterium]MBF0515427.1 glycosyltransferase [Desulfovibrionaceae bacterium]
MTYTVTETSNDLSTPLLSCVTGRKPVKVVLLLQDLYYGGTQSQTLELAKRLDRRFFDVEIWCLIGGNDLAPRAEQYGIPVTWLTAKPGVGPHILWPLWKKLKQGGVDILLPLTVVPNIWGRIFGRLAKTPVIVGACRGGDALPKQHERFLWRLADHHMCNTTELKRQLTGRLGIAADRVTVIANGVDTDKFVPPAKEFRPVRQVILCVARFAPAKDHETLLKAFQIVAPHFPAAELWMVGEGPLKANISKLAARSRLSGRMRIYDGTLNLIPFYHQASILALSSVEEGLPNVVLEGMACGLPVVATNVGGLPDAILPGKTGELVSPGDPEALARALMGLLADEEKRLAMGEAGRARALHEYSLAAMMRRHEAMFTELLVAKGIWRPAQS